MTSTSKACIEHIFTYLSIEFKYANYRRSALSIEKQSFCFIIVIMYLKAILTYGINLRFSGQVLSWQSIFSNYEQNILDKRLFFKMNLIDNNGYAY